MSPALVKKVSQNIKVFVNVKLRAHNLCLRRLSSPNSLETLNSHGDDCKDNLARQKHY